jgi:hypothetical protein
LQSQSELEAGRREIRAPDRGAVSCLAAAWAMVRSPDVEQAQVSSAEQLQELNAEREQVSMAVAACC